LSKLITVERAQKEVERLQHYLKLVEEYETDTLERWVIKEYAITNSIKQIVHKAYEQKRTTHNGCEVDRQYITDVIKSKPNDDLHKILKSGYLYKTRQNRRKYN